MSKVCYATSSLFPVQSFGDWPLEVWARAKASADEGHQVTVLWLLLPGEVVPDRETAGRLYRERGVELVPSTELEPYVAADEVFSREKGLWILPALRKLHRERNFDRIELPAARGLSLRVIQAAAAGPEFDGARIVLRWGKFGEWNRFRKRRLGLGREDVKRDFMERESVELARDVRASSRGLMDFAADIGWEISHVAKEEPCRFDANEGSSAPKPQVPCVVGEPDEELDAFLRLVAGQTGIDHWLGSFSERLGESAREKLQKAVKQGATKVELLAPRRWDGLPAALREKAAIVVHSSGVADARFHWLAAGRVAMIFDRQTLADKPALGEFQGLSFAADESASLVAAVRAARDFPDWERFFQVAAGGPTAPAAEPEVAGFPKAATPKVLVTVSHYNLGALMAETLEALEAQDYPNCEVLVVDDGSTDPEALAAFRAMKGTFSRFHFVERPHAGYWSPRNYAIAECTAPYIIIVDGDNLPVPRMVSRFVEAIERNPGHAAFSSYVSAFRETREAARAGRFNGVHAPIGGDIVSGLFENVYGDTNSIFRIEAIRAIGGFRENFRCSFGDWEIFHRLVGAGFRLGVVPEVLLHYRRREGGMIRQSPLFPNFFELFRTVTPGASVRAADWRRMNHALHGLALPR